MADVPKPERRFILHAFTPALQVSPFDVNMAVDAGYDVVVPYTDVELDQVRNLTQDAIFSRGPKGVARTGIMIGGRDVEIAADMLEAARQAMVPPFQVSVMTDPSGAFTTAAALVACVERKLQTVHGSGLAGKRALIIGGTGPVGRIAGVLMSRAGVRVALGSRRGQAEAQGVAAATGTRFGASLDGAGTESRDALRSGVQDVEIIIAAAAAGVRVLDAADRQVAKKLLVAADVNAVPPLGIDGIEANDDGVALQGGVAVGIGALAIGNVKYQVEQQLLVSMRKASAPLFLSFDEAYAAARELVAAAA